MGGNGGHTALALQAAPLSVAGVIMVAFVSSFGIGRHHRRLAGTANEQAFQQSRGSVADGFALSVPRFGGKDGLGALPELVFNNDVMNAGVNVALMHHT